MAEISRDQGNRAKLAWVLVKGEIHHVSEYAHLLPEKRPYANCPVCHHQVTLRLGERRVFHAAHRPEDICSVTQPETAKHINAKYLLYQELKKTTLLRINRKCDGLHHIKDFPYERDCLYDETTVVEYIRGWDKVIVEESLDQFRPDLLLMKGDQPIGAVEVLVTHAVEIQKAEYFKKAKLPWVEVQADDILGEEGQSWTYDKVLPSTQYNHSVFASSWICPHCEEAINEYLKEQKQKQKDEEYKKQVEQIKQKSKVRAFRLVDFYYPNRKTFRAIYKVFERAITDKVIELVLDDGRQIIKRVSNTKIDDARKALQAAYRKHIEGFRNKGYIVDDSSMRWQPIENIVDEALLFSEDLFPKRYVWTRYEKWWLAPSYKDICFDDYWKDRGNYIQSVRTRKDQWRQGKVTQTMSIPFQNTQINRNQLRSVEPLPKLKEYKFPKIDENEEEQHEPVLPASRPSYHQKEVAECVYCHQMTDDWWFLDKKSNQCKCHHCLELGIA